MAEKQPGTLRLTKLDAAVRQLDTAIHLWFHHGEPVSVHTLAFAAQKVLHGICEHCNLPGSYMLKPDGIIPGKFGQYMKLQHSAANFFKHADHDADGEMEFNERHTEYCIFEAIQCLKTLGHSASPLVKTFHLRFLFTHPEYFDPKALAVAREEFDVLNLASISREEFFKFFSVDCPGSPGV